MSKRILAFICMLALLVGLLPVGVVQAEESTSGTYMVGYAKKDINPWVNLDKKDPTNLLKVQLTGNGNDESRSCTGLMNDNGDDVVDENDGLFTTCTAVTDDNGTTVLFITLDTLQGDPYLVAEIRNEIMNALGANVINGNQIMISGSHTHSGPKLHSGSGTGGADKYYVSYTENGVSKAKTYYAYIRDQAVAAAVEAYNNRADATMTRGSVDATTATAALGYNGGKGYQMNFLRHYKMTAKYESDTQSYVRGPSFTVKGIAAGGAAALEDYIIEKADDVAVADNTMHLLRFEFVDEESDNKPVVLVNWRAHPTINSGETPTIASSDYVNSLRYHLEKNGYRAAFFQGAGANTITTSPYHEDDWKTACSGEEDANVYGELLANIALYCMDPANDQITDPLPCEDIRIVQRTFKGEIQSDSEGLQAAVAAITNEDGTIKKGISFPYTYTYNNKEYTVNSPFHAEQINQRKKKADAGDTDFTTQEIAVVTLGDSATFVTAPNELSDRYDIDDSFNEKEGGNTWQRLTDINSYAPFVITHANGSNGYLPNALNYDYNSGVEGIGNQKFLLGVGSYEANTSRYTQGTGEALIAEYADILSLLKQNKNDTGIVTKECQACEKTEVDWKPVSYLQYKDKYLGSGHYYLSEDIPSNTQKTVRAGEKLCLDLNGHGITTSGRSFSVNAATETEDYGTLNIFDSSSDGTGSVTSTNASSNPTNGTLNIHGNVNIYGGSYKFEQLESSNYGVCRGGVIGVESTYDQNTKKTYKGTLHMYGGTVYGSTGLILGSATNDNGVGAAIYVSNSEVHLHDNVKVYSGSVPEGGFGPCVALSMNANSKIYLYDNAYVEDICYLRTKITDTSTTTFSNLYVSGTFTGNVGLSNDANFTFEKGTKIGNVVDNADISGATFRLPTNISDWKVYIEGNNLKVKGYEAKTVAVIGESEYDSIQDALTYATEDSIIMLVRDEEAETNISKNAYLDLNGHDVNGKVTVNSGCTLYCKDSQTDDYTVADEEGNLTGYGKLKNVSGTVKGIPVESELAQDGYLMIKEGTDEDKPEYSFHSVDLRLTHITLRPVHDEVCAPSMYYKCNFKGDEAVAAAVKGYGVAVSIQQMPNETNMDSKCLYSTFDKFVSGAAGNSGSSTLLYGIMKPDNNTLTNYYNASTKIFGRAYIQLDDTYMFGVGHDRTLKQVTEEADSYWERFDSLTRTNVITMYNQYASIMRGWNVPNIESAVKNAQ